MGDYDPLDGRLERIGCLCVTDHDTIEGALALRRIRPPEVEIVVGCEFTASDGSHLIGLGLTEMIFEKRVAELVRARRWTAVLWLLLDTGLRLSELTGLTLERVDLGAHVMPALQGRGGRGAGRVQRPVSSLPELVGLATHHFRPPVGWEGAN